MVKCLNIGKNIGKPIYRSISNRERTYTVRLRIIYNGHNARLMHDHVTVINFTLITKLVCTSVTLASFIQREL